MLLVSSILVQFFSAFRWLPSIGKLRMSPVSFVETTESVEVSLVTINRQTSYDPGILRQDNGIIRSLPMEYMRFDLDGIYTETGGLIFRIGPDCVGRA